MSRFTYTPEEQKILDERDRKQAEAKAAFRVEQDKMVAEFKTAGLIKPCRNCDKDRWDSVLLTLSGRKIESAPESGLVGMFAGIFDFVHSATVLTCLVLTCGNCGAVQFFNMEPFNEAIKAQEQAKAETVA